jgi:hypothetical protein
VGRFNILRAQFEEAVGCLTECDFFHARRRETPWQIRAVSERAAVRLFYVCWSVLALREQPSEFNISEVSGIEEQFNLALSDLRKCLELEREVPSNQGIAQLERQYITNLAAAQSLRYLLSSRLPNLITVGLSEKENNIVRSRIDGWLSVRIDFPAAAQVDLLAFRALEFHDADARSELSKLGEESHRHELAIDRALLDAFVRLVHAGAG